jgi:hypothetical protein
MVYWDLKQEYWAYGREITRLSADQLFVIQLKRKTQQQIISRLLFFEREGE